MASPVTTGSTTIVGKKLVVILGRKKAVAIAVRNMSGRRRWSKLQEWLGRARCSHHRSEMASLRKSGPYLFSLRFVFAAVAKTAAFTGLAQ
ncbi:MAG: hypothetical protein WBW73_29170 [Rhodoplanes sp.]